MSKDNSGPAFPIHPGAALDGQRVDETQGMTLRDYFAAKSLSGLFADGSSGRIVSKHGEKEAPSIIARYAYQLADAMLKEREK